MWPVTAQAPWWLLTNYPEQNDVMTPLDGVVLFAYLLAAALTIGGTVMLLLSGRAPRSARAPAVERAASSRAKPDPCRWMRRVSRAVRADDDHAAGGRRNAALSRHGARALDERRRAVVRRACLAHLRDLRAELKRASWRVRAHGGGGGSRRCRMGRAFLNTARNSLKSNRCDIRAPNRRAPDRLPLISLSS